MGHTVPSASSREKQRQGLEGAAQGFFRSQAQPILQDGRIDAAEVDRDSQVAVDQLGEARVGPEQPRPNARARREDRAGRSMVAPLRSVLGDAPAEFALERDQPRIPKAAGEEATACENGLNSGKGSNPLRVGRGQQSNEGLPDWLGRIERYLGAIGPEQQLREERRVPSLDMVGGQRDRVEGRTQADVFVVEEGRGEVGPSDGRAGRDPGSAPNSRSR